jgi:hypothetical protein
MLILARRYSNRVKEKARSSGGVREDLEIPLE